MTPLKKTDALYQAQTENRHLKDTLGALRQELELLNSMNEETTQKTVASANDEINQLKVTVTALREEMESLRFENAEKVQEAVAASHD